MYLFVCDVVGQRVEIGTGGCLVVVIVDALAAAAPAQIVFLAVLRLGVVFVGVLVHIVGVVVVLSLDAVADDALGSDEGLIPSSRLSICPMLEFTANLAMNVEPDVSRAAVDVAWSLVWPARYSKLAAGFLHRSCANSLRERDCAVSLDAGNPATAESVTCFLYFALRATRHRDRQREIKKYDL